MQERRDKKIVRERERSLLLLESLLHKIYRRNNRCTTNPSARLCSGVSYPIPRKYGRQMYAYTRSAIAINPEEPRENKRGSTSYSDALFLARRPRRRRNFTKRESERRGIDRDSNTTDSSGESAEVRRRYTYPDEVDRGTRRKKSAAEIRRRDSPIYIAPSSSSTSRCPR